MIRVLIVDDEPLARDTLRMILETDPEVAIVAACTGADAPAMVTATRPDLVFLDVEMPRLDGFDVVAAIGVDAVPAIVFVTAYDRYAVRAFEVHALDYVLKPFDDRRLLAALARAKQRSPGGHHLADLIAERERAKPHVQRFVVRGRDKTVLVNAAEVDWLEAADDYVELHTGAVVHIMRERLSDLELRLDPARFIRIHRRTIVNIDRVRELHPLFRGDAFVMLDGGARLRLSRSRRSEFERRLSGSPHHGDSSPQTR
ncbi:MAG: LytTR family DNA-binding domain-containing protein [Kofleriaceae bacterium]